MNKNLALMIFALMASPIIAAITISPEARTFSYEGGGGGILTAGDGTWKASTSADWISIEPAKTGTANDDSVAYVVAENPNAETRVGTIDVSGNTHTVTQTGYPCSVTPSSAEFGANGGAGEIVVAISSGIAWKAASSVNWIQVNVAGGSGSGACGYSVEPNTTIMPRSGIITIAGKSFTVSQSGLATIVSPTETTVDANEHTLYFTVSALSTTSWTAASGEDWITITRGMTGTGGSTVVAKISANPNYARRYGTIIIGGSDVTVTQLGNENLSLEISPTVTQAAAEGVYGNISIDTTPNDTPWRAVSLSPWIVMSENQDEGVGDGHAWYVIPPNPTLSNRTGRVEISLNESDDSCVRKEYHQGSSEIYANIVVREYFKDNEALVYSNVGNNGEMCIGTSSANYNDFGRLGNTNRQSVSKFFQCVCSAMIADYLYIPSGRKDYYVYCYEDFPFRNSREYDMESAERSYCVYNFEPWAMTKRSLVYQTYIKEDYDHSLISGESTYNVWVKKDGRGLFRIPYFKSTKSVKLATKLTEPETTELEVCDRDTVGSYHYFYKGYEGHYLSKSGTREVKINNKTGYVSTYTYYWANRRMALPQTTEYFTGYDIEYKELTCSQGGVRIPGGEQVPLDHEWNMVTVKATGDDHLELWVNGVRQYSVETESDCKYIPSMYEVAMSGWGLDSIMTFKSADVDIVTLYEHERPDTRICEITQSPFDVGISPTELIVPAEGGSYSIDVSTAENVQWETSTPNDWITLTTEGTSFTTPGEVTFDVAANLGLNSRTGVVYAAGMAATIIQAPYDFSVEADPGMFDCSGGNGVVFVDTTGPIEWSATSEDDWISIDENAQGSGGGYFGFSVSQYTVVGGVRTGCIDVSGRKAYVTQHGTEPTPLVLTISDEVINAPAAESHYTIDVSLTTPLSWNVENTNAWITITSETSFTDSGTVALTVLENLTDSARSGIIVVAGVEVKVNQAKWNTGLSYDGQVFKTDGGMTTVYIQTDATGGWVSSVDNDCASWITIIDSTIGRGPGSFRFVVSPFASIGVSRIGRLYVNGQTIFVAQCGYDMSVDPTALTVGKKASNGNVQVTAPDGYTWEAVATVPWIRILDGETGVGSGTLRYEILDNDTGETRIGKILIGGTEYVITQESRETPIAAFDGNGNDSGVVPGQITADSGSTISLPDSNGMEKLGYSFSGWSWGQTVYLGGEDFTMPSSNITFCASWTANSYSIAYNPGEGSGEMAVTPCTYDEEGVVAANGFTYYGHVFVGWATEEGGEVVYAAGQVVTNLTAEPNGVVTLYAVWEKLAVAAPVFTPADGSEFTDESCEVTIACATEGAAIYYSTNGTPRTTDKYKYTGPFSITDTATIKAIAVCEGEKSGYTTATITKRVMTLADALGVGEGVTVTTGDDIVWSVVVDDTAEGGLSAKSGAIVDGGETWLKATVSGAGTLSFRCKTSCEHDDSGDFEWDCLMVFVDGAEREDWRVDGESGWLAARSIVFTTSGEHFVKWVYHKDDEPDTSEGDDCAWIANVVWTPVAVADPIPEIASDGDVPTALDGSGDEANLKANITTKTEYDAYRAWAGSKSTHDAVKESFFAWTAFALDAPEMVGRTEPITQDDIEVGEVTPVGEDGALTLEVGLKDVQIGGEADKERLVKVFGLEGASELDTSKFTSDNVTVTADIPKDGMVKLTAEPKPSAKGDGKAFFMRVRVNQ